MIKQGRVNSYLSLGFGVLLAYVSSCSHFKAILGFGFSKPEVQLVSVKIGQVSLSKISLNINLKVYNPNEFSLDLDRLDYQLKINETLVAEGKHQEAIILPAGKVAEIILPAAINLNSSVRIIKELIAGRKDQFIAKWLGTAYFQSSFGPIKIEHCDSKTLS